MNRFSFLTSLALAISCLGLTSHVAAAAGALDGYADYAQFEKQVEAIAKPGLATVSSLGTTLGGRKILAITLGSGKPGDKPAILIVGNVHAPQLMGSELAVGMARRIVERADRDKDVKQLLDRFTFYVIPRPSPDASEAFFQRPSREREGNLRKTSDDRDPDAAANEPADLNGDGLITMMRVADSTGRFMPHPADPRVLIESDPLKNENGQYDLYVEGRHDVDAPNAAAAGQPGVAFNHNFSFRYPYFKPGAGPHPVSEIETRAVADFAFDHPNIAAVFCFSPEDNLMHPWQPDDNEGKVKSHIQRGDLAPFEFIAEKYRKLHGGSDAPASPSGEGSFSEWAYLQFGRWSFAARGWWIPKIAPPAAKPGEEKKPDEPRGAEQVNALRWFAQEKTDGFVPWKAVKHPDFPDRTVEVGGFKPFLLLNPPAKELGPLAEKHTDFVLELARLLPLVKIHEAKAEPLGGGIQRITVTVMNSGYLPTASEMGKLTGEVWPLILKLEAPKGSTYLKGTPQKELDRLHGGEKTEWLWLIRAPDGKPGQAKITVSAPAVGSDSATVELK